MPKKKKTRKQKIIADSRYNAVKIQSPRIVDSIGDSVIEYKTQPQVISPSRYRYISSDLIKTLVLTVLIIAGELALAYWFIWRSII